MRASNWLTVRASAGSVIIQTIKNIPFTLVAATCDTGTPPSYERRLTSLMVRPQEAKLSLIAITINTQGHGYGENHPYIIPITWVNGKIVVDLDSEFISPIGRLGQVVLLGDFRSLHVVVSGQRFVSRALPGDPPAHRVVEDADLLLRYLAGHAADEDLEAAATLDKREFTERELAKRTAELERAQGKLEKALKQAHEAEQRSETLSRRVQDVSLGASSTGYKLTRAVGTLASIQQVLQNTGDPKTFFGWIWWVKLSKIKNILSIFFKPETEVEG